AQIARRWASAPVDPSPSVPIGLASDGVVAIDLVADGPHTLIAGTTGSGKSELLRSFVIGLACRFSPEYVNFVLVDFKGGSAFDACAALPHVVGLVTDLDGRLADRALRSLGQVAAATDRPASTPNCVAASTCCVRPGQATSAVSVSFAANGAKPVCTICPPSPDSSW
ncbi:MAG TPA: FtsK/SpoIIIE domain-containing protein, partial [Ilumatobacteraceae bacterium]|nr:FtsK/SpoIIIE domain-containing protein [Ilumatobacteraceae bacterium]